MQYVETTVPPTNKSEGHRPRVSLERLGGGGGETCVYCYSKLHVSIPFHWLLPDYFKTKEGGFELPVLLEMGGKI